MSYQCTALTENMKLHSISPMAGKVDCKQVETWEESPRVHFAAPFHELIAFLSTIYLTSQSCLFLKNKNKNKKQNKMHHVTSSLNSRFLSLVSMVVGCNLPSPWQLFLFWSTIWHPMTVNCREGWVQQCSQWCLLVMSIILLWYQSAEPRTSLIRPQPCSCCILALPFIFWAFGVLGILVLC